MPPTPSLPNHEQGSGTSDAHGSALTLGGRHLFDGGFDASRWQFQSRMGLYCSSSELPAHSARFVVAAAIGATASAAVVFSLMDRPAAETSVAARTLVQVVPARSAPLVAQVQPQSEQTSVLQAERADAAGAIRPQGAAGVAHTGASSAAGAASTTQRPPIAAALVEAPSNNDDGSAACTRSRE